jgi:hypothetical protein
LENLPGLFSDLFMLTVNRCGQFTRVVRNEFEVAMCGQQQLAKFFDTG